MTSEEYTQKIKVIDEELKNLNGLGSARGSQKVKKKLALKLTEKFLKDFGAFWESDNLPNAEKRHWIQLTIKRIWVKIKRIVAIEPHDEFKGLFVSTKESLCPKPSRHPRGRLVCLYRGF